MSDGPHRSLPMRRQWKILAERAAKAAFSSRDVCEALPQALIKDFGEAQLDSVRDVLVGGDQGLLFQEDRVEQLNAIRPQCRGSAVGNIFIDCAIEIAARGDTGEAACRLAVRNALDEYSRCAFRSVEEHYQREDSAHSAQFVRIRLDEARRQCDFGVLAGGLLSSRQQLSNAKKLPKHVGIDEGPPL